MEKSTQTFLIAVAVVLALFFFTRSVREGMSFDSNYQTLNGTEKMEKPVQYNKCLCNQQGSAMYPAYDALGTRVFRPTSEWEFKGDKTYDAKYFSGVI
jgi:hypothetical protein